MSKQSQALEKLGQLAVPQTFARQFTLIGEDASPTSCAQNAMVIAKYLTNQPMPGMMSGLKSFGRGGMKGALKDTVAKNLKQPILIYFMLKFSGPEGKGGGDHHFCAFGLDESSVVVAMGWQDIFTFQDWYSENERGIYKTANFLAHIEGIETGSTKSVIDLCAYLGVVKQGRNKERGVISVLTADLLAFKPRIEVCQYIDLP